MKRELKTIKCSSCGGRGEMPNKDAGEVLRLEREAAGIERSVLAPHFGYSVSYTFDLERGARPLTWELVDKYRTAVQQAVQERAETEVIV